MQASLSRIMTEHKTYGLPKYLQLEQAILKAIEDGSYQAGDQLPPDLEVVSDTRFSLGTVQSAMRNLARKGVIVRDHGRGTFVSKKRTIELEQPWYGRYTREEDEENFVPIFPKVVVRKRIKGEERLHRLLNSTTGDYVQIDRRMNVGNEFFSYNQFFLSADQFGGFLSKSTEELERTNFKIILRREYKVEIERLARSIRFAHFPETICRKIRVPAGTLGIIYQNTAYSQKGSAVFFQESYVPPNHLILHISESPNIPEDWI